MRKLILLMGLMFLTSGLYAFGNREVSEVKGNSFQPKNVTVSSYTATAVLTAANMDVTADYLIINHGSVSVFVSTFTAADTAAANVGRLDAGESFSLDGSNKDPIFIITEKATSNTARIDVFRAYTTLR